MAVPFPWCGAIDDAAGVKTRLGKGDYVAIQIGGYVKVRASSVAMSGLHPHAELVHIPTAEPPLRYELVVFESHPEFANRVLGSADAQFKSSDGNNEIVEIVDSDGAHEVRIAG